MLNGNPSTVSLPSTSNNQPCDVHDAAARGRTKSEQVNYCAALGSPVSTGEKHRGGVHESLHRLEPPRANGLWYVMC
jgi:hypothetical protein